MFGKLDVMHRRRNGAHGVNRNDWSIGHFEFEMLTEYQIGLVWFLRICYMDMNIEQDLGTGDRHLKACKW